MDSTGDSPGVYLREDPIGGTVQLSNVSEPQAVSAEKAAFYLDAALAARTTGKKYFSGTKLHFVFSQIGWYGYSPLYTVQKQGQFAQGFYYGDYKRKKNFSSLT